MKKYDVEGVKAMLFLIAKDMREKNIKKQLMTIGKQLIAGDLKIDFDFDAAVRVSQDAASEYKELVDTMQEEYEKQQERKGKMNLAGQMALEELKHKENGPYFSDILKEMQELYEKKNHDYGNSFSETIQEFGFTPAIARINDKLKRIKQMVKGEQMQVDESMRDNLIDMANYCILTIIELDKIK